MQILQITPGFCLEVPHTIECLELIEHLAFLVSMSCSLYPRRDRTLVFKERRVIKPLNKLANFGDNWNDGVVWGCIKEPSKHLENKFLIFRKLQVQSRG